MKYLWFVMIGGLIFYIVIHTNPPRKEHGKIKVDYWYMTGALEEYPPSIKRFNESQDSIEAVPTGIPWREHERKMLAVILSGSPPDVIAQVGPISKWATRGALTPLNEFIEKDDFDPNVFFPALWEEMQWDGKVYGIPTATACYCLFYNKKLFKEAGLTRPPRTWDEVIEFSDKLIKRDKNGRITQAGFIPNYGNLSTFLVQAWQGDAKFLSDDGKRIIMTSSAVIKSLDWTVDFYDRYGFRDLATFHASFGQAELHGFTSGRLAMAILDNSFQYQLKKYAPDLDYGVVLIPSLENGETATSAGAWWIAIPKGAKNPEAAWEFMKFHVSKETQLASFFAVTEPLLPSNKFALLDSAVMVLPNMEVFHEQMEWAHSPTIAPLVHDQFWREYFGAVERALHHIESPEQALKVAEERLQYDLDRAVEYNEYVKARNNSSKP